MTRLGTGGLCGLGTGVACFAVTALLGPSVFQPELEGPRREPPYALDVHPSPYLVIGLVVAGIVASTVGLGLCFAAVRRGWRVRPLPLVLAGIAAAVAFMVMPPVGSTDHLNYASYGRMAATGHDPYRTSADDLPKDPVAGAPEEWRTTPSVYGPIATGGQAFAAWLGSGSVRLTVFVLSVLNTVAFAATSLILYRTSRSEERRLRTALLWTCNPLVLFHLIAGAHNDVLAIAPMVAALAVAGGRTSWARGLAAARWRHRHGDQAARRPRRGRPRLGAAPRDLDRAPVAADRGAGRARGGRRGRHGAVVRARRPHALDQVREASNMVSFATPWHLVDESLGRGSQRDVIKLGAMLLGMALFLLLFRALPKDDLSPDAGATSQDAENRRVAVAIVLAWLLAAPYALPWYDGFGWALLALLPWTRIDWILLAHTAALSLAYLPPARPPGSGCRTTWSGCSPSFGRPSFRGRCWRS